ncbi:hypothetical protein [Streptomyces griseochromogenes]|uniref:hypothetical protein n=1 Tax=Streptomyces griseochromogenes TaxID=68214 RepID=UPI0037A36FDF
MEPNLPETFRRLNALIEEQKLDRSELLDPEVLATRTALPVATVRTLLRGGDALEDSVAERVCARIKVLSDAYLSARPGQTRAQLVNEIAEALGVSKPWARQVCEGRKLPNVTLLHQLVQFFEVDASTGEAFFTAAAPDALNRALRDILTKYENPERDPLQALLARYGVKAADMRLHDSSITPEQLESLLEGVFQSLKPKGDREG